MITAKLDKTINKYTLDIRGHADFYPEKSLICSACSAIVCTLIDNLFDLSEENKIDNLSYSVIKGNARIEFETKDADNTDNPDVDGYGTTECEIILFSLLRGFELLQKKYPEDVHIFL